MSVERLWLAAWLEGLREVTPAPALRLAELPPKRIPLDDTGRAPVVPLRTTGGDPEPVLGTVAWREWRQRQSCTCGGDDA